jgi:hypothetical protein
MRLLLLPIPIIFLLACSSVEKREAVRADHDRGMNIPAVDDMIVSLKKEYIERCYMPVLKRTPSNSPRPCETALFQLLERRYSMEYTQDQVDYAADEIFFPDFKERLTKKMQEDRSLRRAVGKRFRNMDEVMAYYKSKYSFRNKN